MTITFTQSNHNLHFVLFPFMAQGHMIPMVDVARILAQRGVTVTIITTPLNAARFEKVLARAVASGLPINLVCLELPFGEAGLPEGYENLDMLNSMGYSMNFLRACNLLERPVEKLLAEMSPPPSCIIGDLCLPYTNNVAEKFQIPKIVFHGMGCFCLLCLRRLRKSGLLDAIESETEYFSVPDFPDKVEFTKPQVPFRSSASPEWTEIREKMIEADFSSYGVIVNTFQELEPAYVNAYKKARDDKVWCIGPVSSCNNDSDKSERGSKPSIDKDRCLKWLDSREPASVLYVCMGSLCNLPLSQLIELGRGLEESNRPFVWVIRGWEKYNELGTWISESGFEERIKDRGLLIKGWAPQVLILSHPSVGGFLTHCGWNSTLEGITAGVPLLTWPLFADQFCNEKIVVQILRAGVRSGVEVPIELGEEEKIGVLVDKEGVVRAVKELMGDSKEAEDRRRRVKELSEMAKKAVEEGGSSYMNISSLIEDIREQQAQKEDSDETVRKDLTWQAA